VQRLKRAGGRQIYEVALTGSEGAKEIAVGLGSATVSVAGRCVSRRPSHFWTVNDGLEDGPYFRVRACGLQRSVWREIRTNYREDACAWAKHGVRDERAPRAGVSPRYL